MWESGTTATIDGMLLCHLLLSVLRVRENHSLDNLLGFQCVFQLRAAAVGRFAWWLVAEHMWRSVVMQLQSCSDRFRSLISYSIRSIDSSCIVSMTMSMGCLTDTELHGATARAHAN